MSTKTILICDDDEGILDMLNIILEDSGYKTITENNSLNIYKTIEKEQPQLLLLDLWMPILSGDQILRQLRTGPLNQSLPVIVISASPDGEKIAREAGANDYLSKPFDIDVLIQKVTSLLN